MVVEAKDSYDVLLLPGDGIGPEITAATVNALEPLQSLFKLNFKEVRVCFLVCFPCPLNLARRSQYVWGSAHLFLKHRCRSNAQLSRLCRRHDEDCYYWQC